LPYADAAVRVNYTIFARNGSTESWFSLFNGTSGVVQTLAGTNPTGFEKYVYMYQLHVNLGASGSLTQFEIPQKYSSMGYISGTGLFDTGDLRYIAPSYNVVATPQYEVPLDAGATVQIKNNLPPAPPLFTQPLISNPTGGSFIATPPSTLFNLDASMTATKFTPILFATGDLAPMWNTSGAVFFGGNLYRLSSGGGIAAAVPEPGTMLLSALGMSAFGGLGLLRRRRQKAEKKTA
jgi:hypothetical protein